MGVKGGGSTHFLPDAGGGGMAFQAEGTDDTGAKGNGSEIFREQ